MDNYLGRIKDYLNGDTVGSQATKVALSVVALAGSLGIVFIAAGMGNAVRIFDMFKGSKRFSQNQIRSAVNNLYKDKYIEYISDKRGITTVRITNKGKSRLKSFAIDLISITKPNQWDKKWRMVMFDLPVKFTKARNSLRLKLKQLGFVQFQKSVWIYPYPCTDELLFIADYFKIGKYVEILEATNILRELKFKKYFNLI